MLGDAGPTSFTTSAFDKLWGVTYLRQEFLAPSEAGVGRAGEKADGGEEGHRARRDQKVNPQIQGSILMSTGVFLITHLAA